jgi:uncharacterized membrane protein YbhN (UPF0104 family)
VEQRKHGRGGLLRWLAVAVAIAIFARTLASANLGRTAGLVAQSGGWIALGLLPYGVAVLVDAFAWRTLLGPMPMSTPPLAMLFRVRVRCDALGATLPGGSLVGESLAPTWLRAWMPLEAGVAAVAGRKCTVGFAEGLYLVASVVVGFSVLHAQAAVAPWIVLGLGVLMLAMFGGASVALASGSIAAKVHRLLASLPIPPLRTWIATRSRGFTGTDARLAALFRMHPLRLASACGLSLVAWSIESVETWLLLHLVGVPMPLTTAFAFEASVSLLRSLAAFSPGGLGFQDAGYVAALVALGVPDAATAGAAFIVLKRAKELVWALAGYGSLALPDARGSAPARRVYASLGLREARS